MIHEIRMAYDDETGKMKVDYKGSIIVQMGMINHVRVNLNQDAKDSTVHEVNLSEKEVDCE